MRKEAERLPRSAFRDHRDGGRSRSWPLRSLASLCFAPARLPSANEAPGAPYFSTQDWEKCGGGELNPQAFRHRLLRPACLPVSPPPRRSLQ